MTKVELRKVTLADSEMIVKWRNENRACFFSDTKITVASHEEWLRKHTGQYYFGIECEGVLVGTIALYNIDDHKSEYGRFLIDPKKRNRGLGKQALSLLLAFGFRELGLYRIYGDILRRNLPAIKVAKSAGLVMEGIFRSHIHKNGKFLDVVRVGILRGSWKDQLQY